jgi:hypothetical protein
MTKEQLSVSAEFADRWLDSKSAISLSTRTQAVRPRDGSCEADRQVALVHESRCWPRRLPIWGFPDPVTSHAEHQVPSSSQVQDEVSRRQLVGLRPIPCRARQPYDLVVAGRDRAVECQAFGASRRAAQILGPSDRDGADSAALVAVRIGSSRCGRRRGVSISPSISPSQECANPPSVAPLPAFLLAAIKDPDSIERVLRAMNARYRARRLPFDVPELAVARAPPDGGGGWLGA